MPWAQVNERRDAQTVSSFTLFRKDTDTRDLGLVRTMQNPLPV